MAPRFAVSLRQSADPDDGERWQLKHFGPDNFADGPSSNAQASAVRENIEMDPLGLPNDELQTRGPWATGQDDCPFLSAFVNPFSWRSI